MGWTTTMNQLHACSALFRGMKKAFQVFETDRVGATSALITRLALSLSCRGRAIDLRTTSDFEDVVGGCSRSPLVSASYRKVTTKIKDYMYHTFSDRHSWLRKRVQWSCNPSCLYALWID